MSVLGRPYRILYLSKGRTGLTDVQAVVFRPDNTVAGYYPLVEAPGAFRGCYYYDYISSANDVQGEYFSKVMSPTEGLADIVRFSLYTQATGGGGPDIQTVTSLTTGPILGTVNNNSLKGVLTPSPGLIGEIADNELVGAIEHDQSLTGDVDADVLNGEIELNNLAGEIYDGPLP